MYFQPGADFILDLYGDSRPARFCRRRNLAGMACLLYKIRDFLESGQRCPLSFCVPFILTIPREWSARFPDI